MICIIEMNKISNSSNEMRDLKSLKTKKKTPKYDTKLRNSKGKYFIHSSSVQFSHSVMSDSL